MNDSWQRYSERMTYRRFKYRSVILFFLAVSSWTSAQVVHSPQQLSADQLLQYYRSLKDLSQQGVLSNELHDGKCGLGIRAQVHSQWNAFSALQKIELKQLMISPSTQKERVIGRFKIFYDTSGSPHVPALLDVNNQPLSNTAEAYVDSVGTIFNYSYSIEVDGLGYTAPPHEQGESYYRIFIQDMNYYFGRPYGLTDWDPSALNLNSSGYPPRYACFVLVDKDFKDYHTKGINALKVTVAHEFHHVVQIGSYGWRDNELIAYEITSTWMEDVVYTDVNDYYNYLQNYFNFFSDGLSFNYYDLDHGGYERCIWAHYLAKRFSPSIMRDVWTRMRTQPFLESTDAALVSIGSNLQTAFAEFTYWNYYTADRADTVKYYSEGNHYPRFRPLQKTAFNNIDTTIGGDVSPLSSSMYEFDLASSDTLTAMIANVDVNAAELGQTLTKRVDVTLSSQALISPYYELENGLKAKIVVADFLLWQGFFSQSSTLQYVLKRLSNLAPNPFRINNDHQLFLPVNEDETGLAKVYLYSSSLSLVYTAEVNVTYQNKSMVVAVSGADLKSKLSSGVYFVIAKTKNNEYRWKVAVIR
jgi:hypothetical protein